jgi:hypothetical protein
MIRPECVTNQILHSGIGKRPSWSEPPYSGPDEQETIMGAQSVIYLTDDGTEVRFEAEPSEDFSPAGVVDVAGKIHDAIAPAVAGAKAVLKELRAAAPDEMQIKFGVKVTGKANWLIAKAATEGTLEVTLTWRPDPPQEPVA